MPHMTRFHDDPTLDELLGDPMTREPKRVVRDVRLGYVSRAAARRDYKVVLRADGSLDAEATAQARAGA